MKWCHFDMLHHIWDKKSAAVTITVIFSSFTQVSLWCKWAKWKIHKTEQEKRLQKASCRLSILFNLRDIFHVSVLRNYCFFGFAKISKTAGPCEVGFRNLRVKEVEICMVYPSKWRFLWMLLFFFFEALFLTFLSMLLQWTLSRSKSHPCTKSFNCSSYNFFFGDLIPF